MIESVEGFDIREIGRHMSRQRYQRGALKPFVPAAKGKPQRQLPRGTYWARWYRYVRGADGHEKRSPREKIITKDLAQSSFVLLLGFESSQGVLGILIRWQAESLEHFAGQIVMQNSLGAHLSHHTVESCA